MEINPNFRFFREPYTDKENYWLINIKNGDVYKINKEVYTILKKKYKNSFSNPTEIISELKRGKVIKNEK